MTFDEENKRIGFHLMKDVDISNETIIYHYMDIAHLCNMLDNGSFYVKRRCFFEDKSESEFLPPRRSFALSPVGDNVHEQDSHKIQNEINEKIKRFEEESFTPTSCWSQGPHEGLLMWKGYTKPQSGVCIKSTIGKFADSLATDTYELWCGKIQYETRQQTTTVEDGEWLKTPNYSGENEIRFYFKQRADPPYSSHDMSEAIFVGIDYRKLIDRIIFSPYMWEDDIKRWKLFLSTTYKIEEKKIGKSIIKLNR